MSATIFDILGTVSDLGWNSDRDFALAQVERLLGVLARRATYGSPGLKLDDIYSRRAPT